MGIFLIFITSFCLYDLLRNLLGFKRFVLADYAIFFPIGLGIISYIAFGLLLLNRFDYKSLVVVFSIIIAVWVLTRILKESRGRNHKQKRFLNIRLYMKSKNFVWSNLLFLLPPIFIGLLVLSNNVLTPISDWDAITLYDFRGKLFSLHHQIPFLEIMSWGKYYYNYYLGESMYTSIAHGIFYTLNWNFPKIMYGITFLSFVLFIYIFCAKNFGKTISLVVSFLLIINPTFFSHSLTAYTNLPYTFFFVVSILLLYGQEKKTSHAIGEFYLSSIALGLSYWTRSIEPYWCIVLLVAFVLSIKMRNIWRFLAYFVIFLIFYIPWNIFLIKVGVDSSFSPVGFSISNVFTIGFLVNLLKISKFFVSSLFSENFLIYILFSFVTIYDFFWLKRISVISAVILLEISLMYIGTLYLGVTRSYWEILTSSLQRSAMFLFPLIVISLASFIGNKNKFGYLSWKSLNKKINTK